MRELFEPESIAVIGASREELKIGHLVLRNLIQSKYAGRLYPVNPKADEILGLKCYQSVLDVPGKVELVVICVPNRLVPAVMEEVGRKGAKAAIVISAGFKEEGKEGAELERQVGEIGRRYGIRILGPNCLGLINTHHNMNATFTKNYPQAGSIAITSQSGAICTTLLDWATKYKVGFSKFISVGNKVDLDEADLLRYLRADERTKVIGMYVEGANRGQDLMSEAYETAKTKPVIAIKAGRTSTGAKAASSHTGALTGSDQVYDAALYQAGMIRVKTIEELFDLLLAFANSPLPNGDSVAIVTNAGGLGVMASDAVSDSGLTLASFTPPTVERLKSKLPEEANVYNPVDVIGDADAARYEFAIRTVIDDPNVSMVVAVLAPTDVVDVTAVARMMAAFASDERTPVVAAFVGGADLAEGISIMRQAGLPNYDSPDRAMRALSGMARYQRIREKAGPKEFVSIAGDKAAVRALIDRMAAEGRVSVTEEEGKEMLKAYGIPIPQSETVSDPERAVKAAERIGFPVVMKIESPDIAHKTDVGGVVVGISDSQAVRDAFALIMARSKGRMPGARLLGVSVQKMIPGREVIVGMVRDPQFGPVLTFGLGGIFVEVMRDVSHRVAPLTQSDVDEMVRSIRAYPILTGARGRKPADLTALKDVIVRMAQLALDFPEVKELEANPVIVDDVGKGCSAVDARATIGKVR
jgi:acetyl coenzyme A synthetase (ADP forming)-like protein